MSGSGFPANAAVRLRLQSSFFGESSLIYASGSTDASGRFGLPLTLPLAWSDGRSLTDQWLAVIAETGDGGVRARQALEYQVTAPATAAPGIRATPGQVSVGTVMRVDASGFPANTRVNLHLSRTASGYDAPIYVLGTQMPVGRSALALSFPSNWPMAAA
ncbi:MAG: hypothetical protein HC915_03285 [Anaerolineae bacterium]|nr:hypothetical protein [Anaerolineae bacterium]